MKKNNNIAELKKVRLKIDEIDNKIIKLIADRFKEAEDRGLWKSRRNDIQQILDLIR